MSSACNYNISGIAVVCFEYHQLFPCLASWHNSTFVSDMHGSSSECYRAPTQYLIMCRLAATSFHAWHFVLRIAYWILCHSAWQVCIDAMHQLCMFQAQSHSQHMLRQATGNLCQVVAAQNASWANQQQQKDTLLMYLTELCALHCILSRSNGCRTAADPKNDALADQTASSCSQWTCCVCECDTLMSI